MLTFLLYCKFESDLLYVEVSKLVFWHEFHSMYLFCEG